MGAITRKDSITDIGTETHLSSCMDAMTRKDSEIDDNIPDISQLNIEDEADANTGEELQEKIAEHKTTPEPIWKSKLWLACQTGDYKEVKEYLQDAEQSSLLTHGRDESGNTALIIASSASPPGGASTAIMELLLEAGADANAKNRAGRTALMQASLWGRQGAVEVLLKHDIPTNIELGDNLGLKAIDMASENDKRSVERFSAYNQSHVERPWLDKINRRRIVERLLEVRRRNIIQVQERLSEAEDKIKKLEEELNASRVANGKIQEELSTKVHELKQARVQIDNLTGRNAEKPIRFRELELGNETQIDFTKTFRIQLSFWNGKRLKPTISYMELDGKHYFAKNGTHSGLNNFISSNVFAPRAYNLFKLLGFERAQLREDQSWFKHAEPQLIAFYMDHFLTSQDLSQSDFKQLKGKKPDKDSNVNEQAERAQPIGLLSQLSGGQQLARLARIG
ncbi:Arp, Ankyrin repeat protein [Pyrenophora tritici-repentis]|uniref:Arp, Ankyrin repeat protein n=1 Tax=Pyrenophora tritici-repentis TaxID=45151 RepID=A0A834VN93_9PLEO|nr:Arp, Ankyrin repeat protein [Pyrenophora tritici-repentis]